MRAAVTLLASLGICAGSGGCGDGGAGPADPDRSPAPPPTPTVAFLSKTVGAPEGGSAVLRLTVAPPPESPITVGYSIGVDDDASTYDADAADYASQPSDTLRVSAGDTIGTIQLHINDDEDIEPAREVMTVTLDAPATGAGFVIGAPETAVVLIEEGVCDRTPRIRDEILLAAGYGHCLEPDPADLAGIADLELCNREDWRRCRREGAIIPKLRRGDFQGLSQLERLTLAGVGLTALPEGVFSDLAGLQSLVLANNRLAQLPERAFSGLSTLGSLDLAGNRLSGLPPGLFSGLSGLWWLELSGNPIEELPPAIFAGLSNLSGLVIANTELSDLRAGVFVGLTKLRTLDLRANPATPFRLPLRIARIDNEDLLAPGPAEITVQVAQGAPFPTEVVLHIEGAALHVDTLDIETGSALGEKRTIAHDSGSVAGTRITVRSTTVAPEDIRGVEFEVADPIVLFAAPSRVRSVPPASGAGSLHRATLSSPVSGTALAASPARRGRTQHRDWSKR